MNCWVARHLPRHRQSQRSRGNRETSAGEVAPVHSASRMKAGGSDSSSETALRNRRGHMCDEPPMYDWHSGLVRSSKQASCDAKSRGPANSLFVDNSMEQSEFPARAMDPVVVFAVDENFAMPLAATLRSALDCLSGDRRMRIYVLDGGIRLATKYRVHRSLPAGRFELNWVEVDDSALGFVPVSGHAKRVNYYRILMPQLLPAELQRVIYLDADLIIRADLGKLWDLDLNGTPCLAAQDCAAPYFDSAIAVANFARCGRHLGSVQPVPNYRELGLDPRTPYLNSGVLLVDLDVWRREDFSSRMIDCLDRNREHVRWWDQYALNVVMAGQWGALDVRWNQGANAFSYPSWSQSPFDRTTFEALRDDPKIIHFTTQYKPWLVTCLHPLRSEFFQSVDRTAWKGWRPWRTTNVRTLFELAKTQERRLRLARRRVGHRVAEFWSGDQSPDSRKAA